MGISVCGGGRGGYFLFLIKGVVCAELPIDGCVGSRGRGGEALNPVGLGGILPHSRYLAPQLAQCAGERGAGP